MILTVAELFDRMFQDFRAALEFVYRHEFAGAMRFANIAGTDNDGFGAQSHHLSGFGAERDRAGLVAGRAFQQLDQRRIGRSFEP